MHNPFLISDVDAIVLFIFLFPPKPRQRKGLKAEVVI
jgi:hypothetical protein